MTQDLDLSIRDTRVGACRVIAVSGELDLATADELRRALTGALSVRTPCLIIDLSGAPFCDSSGLSVLIGAHHEARALGGGARIAAPRPTVRTVLYRVGLNQLLPIHDTVSDAIRAVAAGRAATEDPEGPAPDEPATPHAVAV
jgi:anti-sigma B factor antagonist